MKNMKFKSSQYFPRQFRENAKNTTNKKQNKRTVFLVQKKYIFTDYVHLLPPLTELSYNMYLTYIGVQLFKLNKHNKRNSLREGIKCMKGLPIIAHFSCQTPGGATPASFCCMQSWCKQAPLFNNYSSNNSWLKGKGLGTGAPINCFYKS